MGRALQDELVLLRVSKQLIILDFTQEAVGHRLEQLFMQFSNVRDRAVQDDLDILRVLKHLKYFWHSPKSQLAILLVPS